jgi:hypothetical protein
MIESDLYRMKGLFPTEMGVVERSENCGRKKQNHSPISNPADRQHVVHYRICHTSQADVHDLERAEPISGCHAVEGSLAYSLKSCASFNERHDNEGVL